MRPVCARKAEGLHCCPRPARSAPAVPWDLGVSELIRAVPGEEDGEMIVPVQNDQCFVEQRPGCSGSKAVVRCVNY